MHVMKNCIIYLIMYIIIVYVYLINWQRPGLLDRDQPIMFFYLLCYAAVLLKFTYYAQCYAQEQELLS